MMNNLPTIGLMLLFIADYLMIIVWLMRTADTPSHTVRFSIRGLFVATTLVAVHLGMFTAFIS